MQKPIAENNVLGGKHRDKGNNKSSDAHFTYTQTQNKPVYINFRHEMLKNKNKIKKSHLQADNDP